MCFPSKKQKANFDTEPTTTKAAAANTKAAAPAASAPAAPPPTTTTETATTKSMAGPKIAIVLYSMYGHITKMSEAVKKGIEEAGGSVTVYQSDRGNAAPGGPDEDVRPCKARVPHHHPRRARQVRRFLMGIPTRFGNFPAQWKAFWDSTSGLWASGALAGKYAGAFVSTAGPGGGQETTVLATISTLTHHGVIYVPLGYSQSFGQLTNLSEVHGGSPWGAGTFAAADGSRQPTALELEIATIQGKQFYGVVSKVKF
ncbi:flavoprotein-like protein [Mycena rosella]|uniref:Flavoprotein-like protein n=1 Tax=Mycena rosella TaxID=1033263 RepID=A0AAD7BY44_MYCRO|nr:flavoprotein-like protein [Mycena rosella]